MKDNTYVENPDFKIAEKNLNNVDSLIQWDDFHTGLFTAHERYGKTNILCPSCGAVLYVDNSVILTSNPPELQYVCMSCGWQGSK